MNIEPKLKLTPTNPAAAVIIIEEAQYCTYETSHYWPCVTLCSVCQLILTAMKTQPALAVIELSFPQTAEENIPAYIYTHHQTGLRLILNLNLSTVCLCISLFDLSLIQSSHRKAGALELAASIKGIGLGEIFFLFFIFYIPLSFSFDDQGDLLTCPPLSCRLAWHQRWHDYS